MSTYDLSINLMVVSAHISAVIHLSCKNCLTIILLPPLEIVELWHVHHGIVVAFADAVSPGMIIYQGTTNPIKTLVCDSSGVELVTFR